MAIERAMLPKISYFSDYYFLFTDTEQLSAKLAERPGCKPEPLDSFDANMSICQLEKVSPQIIKKVQGDSDSLTIYYQNVFEKKDYGPKFIIYRELVRADFTGDGYEEILCLYADRSGGSFHYSGLALLQKQNPSELINLGSLKLRQS